MVARTISGFLVLRFIMFMKLVVNSALHTTIGLQQRGQNQNNVTVLYTGHTCSFNRCNHMYVKMNDSHGRVHNFLRESQLRFVIQIFLVLKRDQW